MLIIKMIKWYNLTYTPLWRAIKLYKNIMLIFFFSTFFILCSVVRISGYEQVIYAIYIMMIFSTFVFCFINGFKFYKKGYATFLIYFYLLTTVISAFLNKDMSVIITSLIISSAFIFAINIIPILDNHSKTTKYVALCAIFATAPLILIPLFFNYSNYQYAGIFYNPNSFGNTVVTLFAVVFAIYLTNIQKSIEGCRIKYSLLKHSAFLCVLMLLAYLVLTSNSRTSFVSMLAIIGFGIMAVFYYLVKNKKVGNFIIKSLPISFVGIIVMHLLSNYTNFGYLFYTNVYLKTQAKLANNDVLDLRGDIWVTTLKDSGVFGTGQGSQYFTNTFELGAHNTFVKFIGTSGYLPTAILLFLFLYLLFISGRFLRLDTSIYKYVPFIAGINFFMLSIAEDMTFKLAMFVFIFGSITAIKMKNKVNSLNTVGVTS